MALCCKDAQSIDFERKVTVIIKLEDGSGNVLLSRNLKDVTGRHRAIVAEIVDSEISQIVARHGKLKELRQSVGPQEQQPAQ